MSPETSRLLAHMSHSDYSLLLVLPIIIFALVMHRAGIAGAKARSTGNRLANSLASVVRWTALILVSANSLLFAAVLFHVGCAGVASERTRCRSNAKQLTQAMLMYGEDNDERMPLAARWDIDTSPEAKVRLTEKAGTQSIYHCPALSAPWGYGMNAALSGVAMERIEAPADTIALFDATHPSRSRSGGPQDVDVQRHSSSAMVGFMDGHAKSANRYVFARIVWQPVPAVSGPVRKPHKR